MIKDRQMNIEYTQQEKIVLSIMFQSFSNLLNALENNSDVYGYIEDFSSDELYALAEKLGVEY